MFSNDGITGGYNRDVLDAEPATPEATQSLIEEIKTRAKGCITSRNFPESIKLYTKAIELSADNASAKAILHANRSMCYLGMNNAQSALEDATIAISTDATYIKGYYRKAMAQSSLSNFRGAREALMEGLTLKPDDKELKAQLVKVEADLSKPVVAKATTVFNTSSKTSTTTTTSSSSSSSKTTKTEDKVPPKVSAARPSSKPTSQKEESSDDDEDLKSLNLRGYKINSSGKKTTFFNNELDETAKTLIGSIAPKKLESVGGAASPVAIAPADSTQGSAWNTAGTYEERIVTPWVEETLTSLLTGINSSIPSDKLIKIDAYSVQSVSGVSLIVTGVENLAGHAQVTMMRGKKKHMCDFSVDVKFTLTIHTATGDQTVDGKVNVVDITADKEYEITGTEVTHFNKTATTASSLPGYVSNFYNSYVRKSDNAAGLQKAIHTALMTFCDEFKTK